jgi:hypothetical protein
MQRLWQTWMFAVLVTTLAGSTALSTPGNRDYDHQGGNVRIAVGLVWEGETISDASLMAIKNFRVESSDIRLIHFVAPALLARSADESTKMAEILRSVVLPADTFGVQLAPWKSVVEKSGAIFRSAPTFWGASLDSSDCRVDCGREVPLYVYSDEEVRAIIHQSRKIFAEKGFATAPVAHVQGWLAAPSIQNAMRAEGITHSFSAVPVAEVERVLQPWPLLKWIHGLWAGLTPNAQPFDVVTPSGMLTEMTMSGAVMDYASIDDIKTRFKKLLTKVSESKNREFTFYVGTHSASAPQHIPRLSASLKLIHVLARDAGIKISPLELPQPDPAIPLAHSTPGKTNGVTPAETNIEPRPHLAH